MVKESAKLSDITYHSRSHDWDATLITSYVKYTNVPKELNLISTGTKYDK